ncbi:hypothetical protein ACPV3U_17400 [Vibrio rotiferianus]|uniref:hypothetical protein n=1 Tax=Vibrio rotiferianus TaxID=190895 RepID=UPI00406A22F8
MSNKSDDHLKIAAEKKDPKTYLKALFMDRCFKLLSLALVIFGIGWSATPWESKVLILILKKVLG